MNKDSVIIPVSVSLSAVIAAPGTTDPQVLTTRQEKNIPGLPSGAFDPVGHRTFELGLRQWVREQTGFDLGYVEQLYTFGDQGRDSPRPISERAEDSARPVSVGYLGLTPERTQIGHFEAVWDSWYRYFPWEDHRKGPPAMMEQTVLPALSQWADSPLRQDRVGMAFGVSGHDWIEERVLERYELLYEAGLVDEAIRDQQTHSEKDTSQAIGKIMRSDHRRILATAMGRLRGKLKYRPVIFELMPEMFTLSALQKQIEAILGQVLHTQNFRRALARSGLVVCTERHTSGTAGRPAKLFQASTDRGAIYSMRGIVTPILR